MRTIFRPHLNVFTSLKQKFPDQFYCYFIIHAQPAHSIQSELAQTLPKLLELVNKDTPVVIQLVIIYSPSPSPFSTDLFIGQEDKNLFNFYIESVNQMISVISEKPLHDIYTNEILQRKFVGTLKKAKTYMETRTIRTRDYVFKTPSSDNDIYVTIREYLNLHHKNIKFDLLHPTISEVLSKRSSLTLLDDLSKSAPIFCVNFSAAFYRTEVEKYQKKEEIPSSKGIKSSKKKEKKVIQNNNLTVPISSSSTGKTWEHTVTDIDKNEEDSRN
jgi:hypothetical protein